MSPMVTSSDAYMVPRSARTLSGPMVIRPLAGSALTTWLHPAPRQSMAIMGMRTLWAANSGDLFTGSRPPAIRPTSQVVHPRSQQIMSGRPRNSEMNLPPSRPPVGPEATASASLG